MREEIIAEKIHNTYYFFRIVIIFIPTWITKITVYCLYTNKLKQWIKYIKIIVKALNMHDIRNFVTYYTQWMITDFCFICWISSLKTDIREVEKISRLNRLVFNKFSNVFWFVPRSLLFEICSLKSAVTCLRFRKYLLCIYLIRNW